MADNQTKTLIQKVVIDTKDFINGVKKANQEAKAAFGDMNKDILENSKQFAQNEAQAKQWGASFRKEVADAGAAFKKNLITGAKAITLDAGFDAIKKGAKDAIDMAEDASKTFADIRSRIGATDDQLKRWEKNVDQVAIKTKASLNSLEQAFANLTDSADPEEIQKFLDVIGGATVMTGGDSKSVTDFVKKSLLEQGKEINKGNVTDLMTGADILRRNGRGFGSMQESMAAMGSLDQRAIAQMGLSSRDVAAMLSGASRSGVGGAQATEAISGLLKAGSEGKMNALSSILGVSLTKGGKLDLSQLGKALGKTQLGGDEKTSRSIFKRMVGEAGMSEQGAEGLYDMIRKNSEFSATMEKAQHDTKKFSESAEQAADNLKDSYQKMQNSIVVGFKDIFSPLVGMMKPIMDGDFKGALSKAPSAIMESLKGVGEHPALIGGAVLGTAAGGMLINSLLKRIPGIGGIAGGLATGKALKQAGVEPVYVVNANEISTGIGGAMGGFMGKAGMVGLAGAAGVAIGSGINALDEAYTSETDQYGRKSTSIERGMGWIANKTGMISDDQYQFMYGKQQTVKVEIDTKDPLFSAKPKATDNQRDSRTR